MRNTNFDPPRWNFIAAKPAAAARFRRWNIAIISFLAFLVLGVFVASMVTRT